MLASVRVPDLGCYWRLYPALVLSGEVLLRRLVSAEHR